MILKALTLENFKGIREPVRIELAPLTLLFGPNNAGKSTIVQALMYAREVLERNNTDVGRTQLGGDIVDLGGFWSLVYNHETQRAIRMRFELDLSPNGLPSFLDPNREEALNKELEMCEMFDGLPGVDTAQFSEALAQLTDVWVEFEIEREMPRVPAGTAHAIVRRYSVGTRDTVYATIVLPQNSEQALLSYFNFGISPFGSGYTKNGSSDFEWDLARIARHWLRSQMRDGDIPSRNLRKGATIAMPGESVGASDNKMPRVDFDKLVSQIVHGEGGWGDDTVDAETGKPNTKFLQRVRFMEQAEALGRFREQLLKEQAEVNAASLNDPFEELSLHFTPEEVLRASSGVHLADLNKTEEHEGWLLGLFNDLIGEDALSGSEWEPGDGLDLTINGTALPNWTRGLQPYTDIWWEAAEKDKDLYNGNLPHWYNLKREYFLGFLSAVIIGPGKLLLEALQNSVYLGPFRKLPFRHYRSSVRSSVSDWASGLAAWKQLMAEGSQPLVDEVNGWLLSPERFDTGFRIQIQRCKRLDVNSPIWNELISGDISGRTDEIKQQLVQLPEEASKLEFISASNGIALAPQDLGGGISQLVPVIVAALHNRSGVVAIEEPEANIHPAFQVVLADLFITQAKASPDVLFLVETHSEHLMLRCLRRIRETSEGIVPEQGPSLRPEDIAVHFLEASVEGPRIHRIRIDKDGEFLDPWPRGFFPERMKEIYGDDL